MQVIRNMDDFARGKGLCVTMGNFDGVHAGHRHLLEETKNTATQLGLDAAVVTFWPHPRTVVPSARQHIPLATREERLRLLGSLTIPLVFELSFTPEMARLSAGDFLRQYLLPANLRYLVAGHDFSMGHDRSGNADTLKKLAEKLGFGFHQASGLVLDGSPVSSSRLRHLLAEGDVASAARLLGRFYVLEGVVGHGEARGRTLGFPTANLENIRTLIPSPGVYATYAICEGEKYKAVTNIGHNPTFNGQKLTVESFLLDADCDLYGKPMRLEFVQRLRGEQKFHDAAALAGQIAKDVDKARKILRS